MKKRKIKFDKLNIIIIALTIAIMGIIAYELGFNKEDMSLGVFIPKNNEQNEEHTNKDQLNKEDEIIDSEENSDEENDKLSEDSEDNKVPMILGIENRTLSIGDIFNKLDGVTAKDIEDGDITSKIKVTGSVDTKKAGQYNLTYSVTDSDGNNTSKTRIITVKEKFEQNEAPVLSGIGNKTINVGDYFNKLDGVSAYDNEDGNLTSKIKITGSVDINSAGSYTLTYSVTDSKGATAIKSRTITVKEIPEENEAPILVGIVNTTIKVGQTFNSLDGVTATDKEDGNITSKISVAGYVDTEKAGQYTLTYSVTDSKGITTAAVRTITVEDYSQEEEN